MKKLKEILFLSDKGYTDLKKAIIACTITNLAMLLPFCITVMVFSELLNPFLGQELDWQNIWLLWGAGIISAIIVFLASKNDYRKTYIASYKESNVTRLRIAEHLRKLPMSFFNTKDLSELTTNMMSDCSSMESMLSSTIPPLIANGISVTLTCVLLALFDWRLALCVFITLPIAFLVIWCSRKYQIKLFEKQVETKLNASSQVQEYLEGIKIIKSCNLSGVHFRTLNRALLEMKKIAVKVEMVVGIFMSSAIVASDYVMIPLQAEEESTNNIQNYISYLIDLQEQFNPGLDMIGFVPYLVDTDSATIKSNLEELYKQHKEDNLVFQNIIKRSNKVSTWSKNGITEHKGYDKKVLSMYENVFFEMLERIIQLENEKE